MNRPFLFQTKVGKFCRRNGTRGSGHHCWSVEGICLRSDGSIYLQTKPKLLPIIFMITADIAGGSATRGDVKCDVASTTPKEEFCIPTCNAGRQNLHWKYQRLSQWGKCWKGIERDYFHLNWYCSPLWFSESTNARGQVPIIISWWIRSINQQSLKAFPL